MPVATIPSAAGVGRRGGLGGGSGGGRMSFDPISLLAGSSITDAIPRQLGGNAGPAISGGDPFSQGVLSAPFLVGEGNNAGQSGPNLTTLLLIVAASLVAISFIRRL